MKKHLPFVTLETELGDHDFCLSRSDYTDTDPTSREWVAIAGIEPWTSSPGVARSTDWATALFLGTRPRYNLVVDEDVKNSNKQTNKPFCHEICCFVQLKVCFYLKGSRFCAGTSDTFSNNHMDRMIYCGLLISWYHWGTKISINTSKDHLIRLKI